MAPEFLGVKVEIWLEWARGLALTMHLHSKIPAHFYLEFIYLRQLRVRNTYPPFGPTRGLG